MWKNEKLDGQSGSKWTVQRTTVDGICSLNSWSLNNQRNFFVDKQNPILKIALVVEFCCKNFEIVEFVTWWSWALKSRAQEKPTVDYSRAHNDHVTNQKSSKCLQQKGSRLYTGYIIPMERPLTGPSTLTLLQKTVVWVRVSEL